MKLRRTSKLLVEPPASATGDIAFNLIVFFLVCAAVQPDTGRKQQIPSSETVEKETEDEKHLEVEIDRARLLVGGEPAKFEEFPQLLAARLPKRDRPE
ncbi:MAG: biopolymer transporter ExbD, partial [Planctomycetes bacterium]|nr:biopolymer transporter ExbD [Planctomycetota bacterium]